MTSLRDKLFARDIGICGICGNPIQQDQDYNVDHIVPLSKGGTSRRENLQVSHVVCNLRKGNKMTEACVRKAGGLPIAKTNIVKRKVEPNYHVPKNGATYTNHVVTTVVQSPEPALLLSYIKMYGVDSLTEDDILVYFERHIFHEMHKKYNVKVVRKADL